MADQVSAEVLDRWIRLANLKNALREETTPFSQDLSEFRQQLELVTRDLAIAPKIFGRFVEDIAAQEVVVNFEEGRPLSEQQKEQLTEVSDELRMYFLLVMIASKNLSPEGSGDLDLYSILEGRVPFPRATIVHGAGGLTYSLIKNICVLLMPRIESAEQCDLIMQEFLNVYELTNRGAVWAIDFSMIRELSLALAGTLMGYTVGSSPRKIAVCWLKEDAMPSPSINTIADYFGCRKIGRYWFPK